tara:strand:+ start:1328 stop:1459 length:132 start_codon:yes stop_codon:yes gene_type:complete
MTLKPTGDTSVTLTLEEWKRIREKDAERLKKVKRADQKTWGGE